MSSLVSLVVLDLVVDFHSIQIFKFYVYILVMSCYHLCEILFQNTVGYCR